MLYSNFLKKTYQDFSRDFTSFGNPVILLLIALVVVGDNFYFLLIAIGTVIIEVLGSLIKLFFYKQRPNKETFTNFLEKIDSGSFPSLHSARAGFVFLMLSSFTDSFAKFIFVFLILLVGQSRIALKKHYLIDILGGYAIGIALFFIMRSFF